MKYLLYTLFTVLVCSSFAQTDSISDKIIIEGDTLSPELLNEVILTNFPEFTSHQERKQYYILQKKVLKVYPYSIIASNKIDSLYNDLDEVDRKRKKRNLIKEREKFLKEQFSNELKNLTRSEGLILVKLVYREQNRTVHSYIKELKSGFSAMFWQMAAKIYDNNLKAEYHPELNKQDALIESILIKAGKP